MTGPSPILDITEDDYRRLHASLSRLFRAWGLPDPENLASEVIRRTIVALHSGKDVSTPLAFMKGTALHIAQEEKRRIVNERNLTADLLRASMRSGRIVDGLEKKLDACLEQLAIEDRKLLEDYYKHDGPARIAAHKDLARQLGLSPDALSMKVYRLRRRLRECLESDPESEKTKGSA